MRKTDRLRLISLVCASFCATAEIGAERLVLVPNQRLPVQARQPTTAELLHSVNCETTYLYLEQHHGQTLLILDVTDPNHVRVKSESKTNAPSSFIFVEPVNRTEVLIQFEDGSGYALLDLSKPRQPTLKQVIADTQALILPATLTGRAIPEANDQGYRFRNAEGQETLLTGVRARVTDMDSGATFLAGQNGLAVIRDKSTEAMKVPCQRYSDIYDER